MSTESRTRRHSFIHYIYSLNVRLSNPAYYCNNSCLYYYESRFPETPLAVYPCHTIGGGAWAVVLFGPPTLILDMLPQTTLRDFNAPDITRLHIGYLEEKLRPGTVCSTTSQLDLRALETLAQTRKTYSGTLSGLDKPRLAAMLRVHCYHLINWRTCSPRSTQNERPSVEDVSHLCHDRLL